MLSYLRPTMLRVRSFKTSAFQRQSLPPPPAPARSLLEGEQTICDKLTAKFAPSQLLVQDISGGCGSFYAITIASQSFKGLSIVKQHRLVTETLKQEIQGIHGLQIKTIAQ